VRLLSGKIFKSLIRACEAWKLIEKNLSIIKISKQNVEIDKALGYFIADDVTAEIDLPPFDKSAVDGFAVRSEDLTSASLYNPALLRIIGEVKIGSKPEIVLKSGEAARIDTGAPLPVGADAVIGIEDCNLLGEYVEATKRVTPYANVVRKGEDVEKGEVVLKKGSRLHPWDIALLKGLGVDAVSVFSPVGVALISIGNELGDDISILEKGGIIDTNKTHLLNLLRQYPVNVEDFGIVKDLKEYIEEAFSKAASRNQLIITTGGVSVGLRDYTAKVVESLGEVVFHGVAIRPGMPVAFGKIGESLVFMLPGNPVAAYINYKLFVENALLFLFKSNIHSFPITAKLENKIPSTVGYMEFARVKLFREKEVEARLVRRKGSSILSSIVHSDGVVAIPEDSEGLKEGTLVKVYLHTRPWIGVLSMGDRL